MSRYRSEIQGEHILSSSCWDSLVSLFYGILKSDHIHPPVSLRQCAVGQLGDCDVALRRRTLSSLQDSRGRLLEALLVTLPQAEFQLRALGSK